MDLWIVVFLVTSSWCFACGHPWGPFANKVSVSVEYSRGCGYPCTFPQVLCKLSDPVKHRPIGAEDLLYLPY